MDTRQWLEDVSKSRHSLSESPTSNETVLLYSISCRVSLRTYLWQAQCNRRGRSRKILREVGIAKESMVAKTI